jgi:hypothetical protein
MKFRRLADALLFHSSVRVTSQYEAARLERTREDSQWSQYQLPTWMRWGRRLTNETQIWSAQ